MVRNIGIVIVVLWLGISALMLCIGAELHAAFENMAAHKSTAAHTFMSA